jgi:uncharacterized lipoprotein YddW (UPF0748 family)
MKTINLPSPIREFRGAWVATVNNIDWPSRRGLSTAQQQAELISIMERAVKLRLNAIIFQVRPACDALYESAYEPWSEYITGKMGRAPEPYYDPLAFAVEEAHKRGLELHAWFNPFRAVHAASKSSIAYNHISRTRSSLVRKYGDQKWLDPGEPAARAHSHRVIMDVVKRYDIDGVHIDDYFYPYKIRSPRGGWADFPDDPSWKRYRLSGGRLGRADWRRQNINTFVEHLYHTIKSTKRWVKFGISPFGIWRPGYPPQIQGMDAYNAIYADARLWCFKGWADYFAPQLYWRIDQKRQSYPVLLNWWAQQNKLGRHLWPGNYTSMVKAGGWEANEIVRKIEITRKNAGASGNIHFSMKALMENRDSLCERLDESVYTKPALVPACPWLSRNVPAPPIVNSQQDLETGALIASWEPGDHQEIRLWVLSAQIGEVAFIDILPRHQTGYEFRWEPDTEPEGGFSVTAIDRYGNESKPALVSF